MRCLSLEFFQTDQGADNSAHQVLKWLNKDGFPSSSRLTNTLFQLQRRHSIERGVVKVGKLNIEGRARSESELELRVAKHEHCLSQKTYVCLEDLKDDGVQLWHNLHNLHQAEIERKSHLSLLAQASPKCSYST